MSTPPKNTQIRGFVNFGLFGLKVSHNVRIEKLNTKVYPRNNWKVKYSPMGHRHIYRSPPSKQLKSQSWPNVTWTHLQRSTLKTIEKSICPRIPQLSYDCTCSFYHGDGASDASPRHIHWVDFAFLVIVFPSLMPKLNATHTMKSS